MRRTLALAGLVTILSAIACSRGGPPPRSTPNGNVAHPVAKTVATQAAPELTQATIWQETRLPSSAAPGASADDSADERQDGIKRGLRTRLSTDLATPRVIPTVTKPEALPGLVQETFVGGLMLPVAFEFAPDGRQLFVNELYGKVRLVEDGELRPDPVVVLPTTQGLEQGALGLALDPNFARNRWFYVFYSQTQDGRNEPRRNRIVRFTEHDGRGIDETIVLDNLPIGFPGPENVNGDHNGGRIGFGPDGKLYVTLGDAAKRSEAKKPKGLFGKILRINPDGSIPSDNPNPDEPIFAMGFRSPFGLDFQPGTGLPWVTDNGPQGHDEINRVVRNGNYGWPDEAGAVPGDRRTIDPVWESGILRLGPTGLAFYTGRAIPEWRNDLFFCDWNTGSLWRLHPQGAAAEVAGDPEVVAQPCRLYVRNGPDGALYFSDHHAIYRLGPPRGSS